MRFHASWPSPLTPSACRLALLPVAALRPRASSSPCGRRCSGRPCGPWPASPVPQRLSLLTTMPRLPPSRSRAKLLTGASGAPNVVRSAPPFVVSILPASSMSIWPSSSDRQVGQFVARGAQVDVALQRLVEERRLRRRRRRPASRPGSCPPRTERRVQIVFRCALSTCSPFGQGHRDGSWLFASPSCRREQGVDRRVAAAVDAAVELQAQTSARRARLAQLATWNPVREVDERAFGAADGRAEGVRIAIGRVEREAGPVEVDPDRAQAQRDTARRSAAADRRPPSPGSSPG